MVSLASTNVAYESSVSDDNFVPEYWPFRKRTKSPGKLTPTGTLNFKLPLPTGGLPRPVHKPSVEFPVGCFIHPLRLQSVTVIIFSNSKPI